MMGKRRRYIEHYTRQIWPTDPFFKESAGHLRRYKCQRLPPYIILHFKRFTKNAFVEEKNPTIVTFPLRGLDFKDCRSRTVNLHQSSHSTSLL